MGTTSNAGLGHGCGGAPQGELEEYDYINKEQENADSNEKKPKRLYRPSPKHKRGGWGSLDPIQTQAEGARAIGLRLFVWKADIQCHVGWHNHQISTGQYAFSWIPCLSGEHSSGYTDNCIKEDAV